MLRLFAFLFALSIGVAHAQVTPGTSPLSVAKGGTGISTLSSLPNAIAIGADPTGATDSTAAINAAINSNGGIFFGCGTYKVSQIVISGAQFTNIVGQSSGWAGLSCVSIVGTSQTNTGVISVALGGFTIKNIIVDHVVPTATVTITIASPAVVSWTNHGLPAGSAVTFNTSGALPTGLVANTIYYVSTAGLTTNAFQVADTNAHALAGTNSINTSGSQSGTQTAFQVNAGAGVVTANGTAGVIDSVTSQNQLTGFQLGATSSSLLQNTTATQNFGDGYAFTNNSGNPAMQWVLVGNNFALNNSGWAFHSTTSIASNVNIPGIEVGGTTTCYNNGLGCFRFDGASGSAIADVSISGLISSGGGGPAIDFENAGINIGISNPFIELRGVGGYGRNGQTPAGTTGAAILFSTGGDPNAQPLITGGMIEGCSQECIKVASSASLISLKISDTSVSDGGINSAGTAGISLLNASAVYYLTNVTSRNAQGSTQAYGLNAAVGANVYLNGTDFSVNGTAGCLFNDAGRPNSNGISVGNGCSGNSSLFQTSFNRALGVQISAPSAPASGSNNGWADTTNNQFNFQDSSGNRSTAARVQSCTNQVFTAIAGTGIFTCVSVTNALLTAGTFSSITGVGALSAGSATTGFTIAASNVTWTGAVPTTAGGCGSVGSPGAFTSFSPTVSTTGVAFTSASATGSYWQCGKMVHWRVTVTVTTVGTASGGVTVGNLPVTTASTCNGYGVDPASVLISAPIPAAATSATFHNYLGNSFTGDITNGTSFTVEANCEST